MTGYEETLSDPSYYGQIVTQTFPLIGNYGVNDTFELVDFFEELLFFLVNVLRGDNAVHNAVFAYDSCQTAGVYGVYADDIVLFKELVHRL